LLAVNNVIDAKAIGSPDHLLFPRVEEDKRGHEMFIAPKISNVS
jgi:hypothetical protein